MKKKVIAGIIALLVLLYVYAAVMKLNDYYNFRFGLGESPYISHFAGLLSWAVPASEFIIVGMLLLPRFRLIGLYASLLLMLSFTIYISVMLTLGSDIPCSCGGILENMSWGIHVVFNSFFVLLSAVGIVLERRQRKLKILSTQP